MAGSGDGPRFNSNDRCQLTRRDELKYVALHFTDYLVQNRFIQKPAIMSRDTLTKMYITYQAQFPSHVKSSEIIEALREARLLKKKRPSAYGDTTTSSIEFKDQIFQNENRAPHQEEVLKPRFRILTNQNFMFKNKLVKDPEIDGLRCKLCKIVLEDQTTLDEHCLSRNHFLRKTYRDNRRSFLKRIEHLEIENADEFNFQILQQCQTQIKFKNVGEAPLTFTFHRIDVLHEVQFITMSYDVPNTIASGEVFVLTLKACFTEYDAKRYPIVLEISMNDSTYYLDLLLEPKYLVLDEDIRILGPTEPYQPLVKNIEPVVDLPIISGNPLPKPENQMPSVVKFLLKQEIPPTLFKILNHGFKKFPAMNEAEQHKLSEVRQLLCDTEHKEVLHNKVALNSSNYVKRFRHLMWIEEHQMHKDIKSYNLKDVVMSTEREFLSIEILGLLEGRPSLIRGDIVYIHKKSDTVKYEGIVHVIEQCKIFVSTNYEFQRNYLKQPVNVEFTFNRYCLKVQHRALTQIDERKVASVLFPADYGHIARKPEVPLKTLFNKLIRDNEQQTRAVKNIVNNTAFPAPYIIYGPPGTGKTATLVEAIMQIWSIFPSSKLCVCAPSNAAADVVAERLIKVIPATHILRIYSVNRPDPPSDLQKCSNYNTLTKELYYPSVNEIEKKTIVILTPITAGRLINAGFTGGYFDYLFIDEAGHALEIELIVPIIGLLTNGVEPGLRGSLVLAGDPKQLGPVVRSTLAIKLGYDMSLLERLMNQNTLYQKDPNTSNYNANVIVKLLNNYRSHEVILHVPNEQFYDGQLLTKGPLEKISWACRWEELPTRNFPLIFHSVKGLEDREKNSPSYFNQLEVHMVTEYVQKLITSRLNGRKVTQEDIGIIAPYRKQVQKIRQHFKIKRLPDINVASVEEFQGQEKSIVIISTVRSRQEFIETDYQFGLGFLRNQKRFNVAITRAKALLIVIGNPDVLQCDIRWRTLMKYCQDNNSYRGPKPSGDVPSNFDVNDKLIMDLSALTINADNIPKDEKPGFNRDD